MSNEDGEILNDREFDDNKLKSDKRESSRERRDYDRDRRSRDDSSDRSYDYGRRDRDRDRRSRDDSRDRGYEKRESYKYDRGERNEKSEKGERGDRRDSTDGSREGYYGNVGVREHSRERDYEKERSDSRRTSTRVHQNDSKERNVDSDNEKEKERRREKESGDRRKSKYSSSSDNSESDSDSDRDSRRKKRDRKRRDRKYKSSKSKSKSYSSSSESEKEDKEKSKSKSKSSTTTTTTSTSNNNNNNEINQRLSSGVYIPPFKLAMMQKQVQDKSSAEYQRIEWDALKKSINGLINKVSYSNVKNIAVELFGENIIRGRGLLCRSIMRAQQVSLPFTNVYAALIAIINTKIPDNGELLLKRLIEQFKKSFRRNDKPICIASTKFIAHLVNQQVCGILVPLEIITLLLDKPTDDSVEVAVDFFLECGHSIQENAPQPFNGIFERFKAILHEGDTSKRTQYQIEELFKEIRQSFVNHPAVTPELDVVELEDQITHETLSIEDSHNVEDELNFFKIDNQFLEHQEQYKEVKRSILGDSDGEEGDSNEDSNDSDDSNSSDEDSDDDDKYNSNYKSAGTVINTNTQVIEDQTDTNLINLRKTIYLAIMSSKDFEECAHKLLKLKIKGHEDEVCNMLIQCCSQERTYLPFYGNLSQRFCMINKIYRELFDRCFAEQYAVIHRLETNRFRNIAKMYAHLFYTDALPWTTFKYIHINEDETNSASRIFLKILFQEMAEFLGIQKLNERLQDPSLQDSFTGIFPKDNPKNTRYSINFFTSISLGALTHELREYLKNAPKPQIVSKRDNNSSDSDSSSDSSSDSDSSYDSSDSSSDDSDSSSDDSDYDRKKKKRRR